MYIRSIEFILIFSYVCVCVCDDNHLFYSIFATNYYDSRKIFPGYFYLLFYSLLCMYVQLLKKNYRVHTNYNMFSL